MTFPKKGCCARDYPETSHMTQPCRNYSTARVADEGPLVDIVSLLPSSPLSVPRSNPPFLPPHTFAISNCGFTPFFLAFSCTVTHIRSWFAHGALMEHGLGITDYCLFTVLLKLTFTALLSNRTYHYMKLDSSFTLS